MNDSPVDGIVERLGSRIRAEREHQGLTVTELSELSGVGRGTVSDLERTARTPSLDTLAKIASGLGVPMPALFDERARVRPMAPFAAQNAEARARLLDLWIENAAQVEIYRLVLTTELRHRPEHRGARGYLTVLTGELSAGAAATPRHLTAGGQLAFALDQPHVLTPGRDGCEILLVLRYPLAPTANTSTSEDRPT